jgi:hypothetical protein
MVVSTNIVMITIIRNLLVRISMAYLLAALAWPPKTALSVRDQMLVTRTSAVWLPGRGKATPACIAAGYSKNAYRQSKHRRALSQQALADRG